MLDQDQKGAPQASILIQAGWMRGRTPILVEGTPMEEGKTIDSARPKKTLDKDGVPLGHLRGALAVSRQVVRKFPTCSLPGSSRPCMAQVPRGGTRTLVRAPPGECTMQHHKQHGMDSWFFQPYSDVRGMKGKMQFGKGMCGKNARLYNVEKGGKTFPLSATHSTTYLCTIELARKKTGEF